MIVEKREASNEMGKMNRVFTKYGSVNGVTCLILDIKLLSKHRHI